MHRNGLSIVAYNRTAPKTHSLRLQGLDVATHPEDAIARAHEIILVLTDVDAIRSLLLNPPCARRLAGKTVIQKDLRLFGRLAASLRLRSESADGVRILLESAIHGGLQDRDYSALYEAIPPLHRERPQ